MKICMVCEGSYPYVSGGVAGWLQMLIKATPDAEFVIWSIATTSQEMNTYKYELPSNVTAVQTFYLGEKSLANIEGCKNVRITPAEEQVLRGLVTAPPEDIEWEACLKLIKKHRRHLNHILMGGTFFDIALELYQQNENKSVFNEYLWSLRGMYSPFMAILSEDFPEADIYHSVSTGYAGIVAAVASYVSGKPFLLSEHGIYTREREEDIIRAKWLKGEFKALWISFFKKVSIIAYKQASVVTTLFETNRTLQMELGCPEEKIELIPNGVDSDMFEPQVLPPRSEESKQYFNIGAILRMVPIKDIKTMIVGFGIAKKRLPNARLNLLGNYDENPDYYHQCREIVREMQIEDVYFHGQVAIRNYLPEYDLLLLTSISEGQPLAILEGLAAAKPYICTNVGDCKNLLHGFGDDTEGDAGFIIPIMDAEALADRIIYSAQHPDELIKMGKAGQRRVRKYYQKTAFLDKFHRIYKELGGQR